MNVNEINALIEQNRALTEMTSLPFSIDKEGKKIAWFNYTVEPSEKGMAGHTRRLFTVDEKMNLQSVDFPCSVEISTEDCQEPRLTEDEYLEMLIAQYNTLDLVSNMKLIKSAVLETFVPIYEKVIEKVGGR